MPDLYTREIPATDPRLKRHVVHDPRSKGFVVPESNINRATWRDRKIRVYDPRPNPNQTVGNCTAVAKAIQFNAVGNRRRGVILGMPYAMSLYSLETQIDPFPGSYPPDDTGSNGLASCKAAQQKGDGGAYYWITSGADGVVQAVMDGDVVSVGTEWDNDMFTPDSEGRVHPGGGVAGGHQWTCRGYWKDRDWILGRCWWGEFRDFWIARADLDNLLRNDGDAHVQERA